MPSILNLGSALFSPFCTSNRLSGDDRVHIVLAGPLTITASSHLSEQPTTFPMAVYGIHKHGHLYMLFARFPGAVLSFDCAT